MTIPALVGPTASGKTALSLVLAERLGAEIISIDSRQVYRELDIGTAKATADERARVPHHGIDVVGPDEHYSAGRFARDARRWVDEIQSRDSLPLLVGGTGFFLRALIDPVFREPPVDAVRRRTLREHLSDVPSVELERWVRLLDPQRARMAAEGGRHRLMRSVEVPLVTGRSLTWWHEHGTTEGDPVPVRVAILTLPRDVLYERIDRRAAEMFDQGLVDEMRGLLASGYDPALPALTATGYREAASVLAGESTMDEAVRALQQRTRRYARRQLTWFRHQLPGSRLELDGNRPVGELADTFEDWWRRTGADRRG